MDLLNGWDTIEEIEPDEIDLQMIQEAQSDPDCNSFVPEEAEGIFNQ